MSEGGSKGGKDFVFSDNLFSFYHYLVFNNFLILRKGRLMRWKVREGRKGKENGGEGVSRLILNQ